MIWVPLFSETSISSYIQIYHSSRQLHEETCPSAAMVGVAEPRRAHHLGSAEERTPGGHRFFWGQSCLNLMCVYICIYGYYIYMLIDLVYFNLRYTHIHREIYIYRANRQMCRPKTKDRMRIDWMYENDWFWSAFSAQFVTSNMAPLLGVEQQHGQNWCARWDPCYNAPVTFWSGLLCMLIPAAWPRSLRENAI